MQTNRRRLTVFARAYIVAASVLAASYLVAGPTVRPMLLGIMLISVIPAGLAAGRVHGFPRAFSLTLVLIAILYTIESVAVEGGVGQAAIAVAGGADLLATVSITGLVAFMVSRRRGGLTRGDLLDGLIIGAGAWLVSWIVLIHPLVEQADRLSVSVLLAGTYLPTTIPLVALSAVIVFGADRPRPAELAISSGLLLNVAGDLIFALDDARHLGPWAYTAADILYIFSVGACAAALVHPTAPRLIGVQPGDRDAALPGRLAAVVVSQTLPLGLLTLVTASSPLDRVVRTVSAFVIMGLVGVRVYTAVRAQARAQARLARAARTDELTNLPNRRSLLETASDSINELWDRGPRPSLYLFDLDGFKNINDSLGHGVGDDLLVQVARRLDSAASSIGATASRASGDEFVVFDPTPADEAEALEHARTIHSIFLEAFAPNGRSLVVSSSCGVASMAAGTPTSAPELFRRADIALYRAKATGRNKIVAFDTSMSERVTRRLEIEHSLRGAIGRDEMVLFHQPIIDIESGNVSGLEALIRWRRADGTYVQPGEFIGVAEETGQIDEIGAWAVLEALTQLRTWTDEGIVTPGTTVSVNVSPRQLADPRFSGVVREALRRSDVAPHLLWLEVTETVMVDNPGLAQAVLSEIRSTGVRIALDDFGTGYSSLSLLQRFPIQRIKIDRAFVNSLTENDNDRALVQSIIGLGDSMKVDIVAEGIETAAQLRMLRQLGCAKAQGYLISRPIPPDAMRSTIEALDGLSRSPEFTDLFGEHVHRHTPASDA